MHLTIKGDVASKKNSKILSFRGSRPMMFPGKVHKAWHTQALRQLYGVKPIKGIDVITLTFFPRTKRRSDLTNRAESILDILVDARIIEDDNWFVVPHIILNFGAVDTKNPRVEIEII